MSNWSLIPKAILSASKKSAIADKKNGAGEGNRTLVTSLEGWRSTIELHPHIGRSSRI